MNRYILIRRLRGPAFLLLVGVIALLNQADILSWGHAWPLFLILAGVLALAERAAMASEPPMPGPPYPGVPYPGSPYTGASYPGAPYAAAPYPGTTPSAPPSTPETSIVPANPNDHDHDVNGGLS
jgi:hypothetical protein